jgi:hypothetical protein
MFFSINYYIILNTCFIDVLQKLPSSQINLYCLSAEISKQQRYRSILHVKSRAVLTASRAPGKSSALGSIPTQSLTGIKLLMYIKLNIYILYWYFQQSQCLSLRKTYSTQHT